MAADYADLIRAIRVICGYIMPPLSMRFELLNELGRGATGIVFKARDRETGAIVAVKQLNADIRVPEREVLLARKVTHTNVCRVYDLFREAGTDTAFISMEYVDGETLSGPLPLDEVLRIAAQIMDGLEAAHRQGVVHRDLKPANIMVARNGTVKIMDFGLAKLCDPQTTDTIGRTGTPAYMAPEQAVGELADARADLYALGFILYELLSGELPSRDSRPKRLTVPAYVEAAIFRCLEEDRKRRFASVAELREALTLKPPVIDLIDRRHSGIPQWTGVVAVGLLILAIIGVAVLSWQSGPAIGSSRQTVPEIKINMLPSLAVLIDQRETADVLTRAFRLSGKFRIVERPEIEKILSELRLSATKVVDPAAAERIGQLVGAQYLMFGSSKVSGSRIWVDARVVRTETGDIVTSDFIQGEAPAALKLTDQLAGSLLSQFK
jgi:serine/threonine protein kinase